MLWKGIRFVNGESMGLIGLTFPKGCLTFRELLLKVASGEVQKSAELTREAFGDAIFKRAIDLNIGIFDHEESISAVKTC